MPPLSVLYTVSAHDRSSVKSRLRDCADGGTGMPCSPSVNPGSCLTGCVTEDVGDNGSGASNLGTGLFIASQRFEKKKGVVG